MTPGIDTMNDTIPGHHRVNQNHIYRESNKNIGVNLDVICEVILFKMNYINSNNNIM